MSLSIYNIEDWSGGATFNKDDITKYGSSFYYSLTNANINNTPSVSSTSWGGMATDVIDGEAKPNFIWKPSYNAQSNHEPKVDFIQFGDGYSQRIQKGINNDLIVLDYVFDLRSTAEITAILHFLHARAGKDSFLFNVPPPYNVVKRFVAKNWIHSPVFKNNHSIKVSFMEVPA